MLIAVDAHVARHVFGALCSACIEVMSDICNSFFNRLDQVIGPRGILANKARILVTNSIAFLKQHDHLIFIRRGVVLESGTYDELIQREDGELSRLMY